MQKDKGHRQKMAQNKQVSVNIGKKWTKNKGNIHCVKIVQIRS